MTSRSIGDNQHRVRASIPDHILDEFHEFYADLAMLSFEFDESCLYQLVDDQYFLVKRDERVYLVNRWAQDKGLNAVWYIVELHHE